MFDWLRRKRSEPLRLDFGANLEFHAAARGEGEQRLSGGLSRLLGEHGGVRRAYLARVRYGEGQPLDMALCLVGAETDGLHDRIGRLFYAMFEQGEHLDVVFIDEAEEQRLREVSSPFFEA